MHEKAIRCESCGRQYPLDSRIYRCRVCNASLEVAFDIRRLKKSLSLSRIRARPFNHARYLELYPTRSLVSLGEGGTPLVRSRNLQRELSLKFELWFKLESQNPTGSFKDRGSSVEIAKAAQSGAKGASKRSGSLRNQVVVASTGNMGASLAAYSAMARLTCNVLTPRDARAVKLRQMLAYGARVFQVRGDYSRASQLAEQASQELGIHLLGDYHIRREGTKSVGFEIADQMPDVDFVACPMGNGTLISATRKAFVEWTHLGFSRTLPRLVGVQASGCSPIINALKAKSPIKSVCGSTIAVAIECGDPLDGPRAVSAILESGGFSEAVSDREILKARSLLARHEGIFAEPAGAASLAGLIKNKSRTPSGSRVVSLITGHGLKAPHTPIEGKVRQVSSKPNLKRVFG
jgi:threonine synthase